MKDVLHVGIATTSEAKINGIKAAFEHFFPEIKIEVHAKKTKSGVDEQPFGKETSKGALNRLSNLRDILNNENISVDYYVSCEAGIDNESIPGEYFSEQVICIYSKEVRKSFFGKSSSWSISSEDIQEIINTDLDQYLRKRGCTGLQDVGNGKYITRSTAVEEGVKAALASEMNYIKSKVLKEQQQKKDITDTMFNEEPNPVDDNKKVFNSNNADPSDFNYEL